MADDRSRQLSNSTHRHSIYAPLIAVALFVAVAPTLGWLQFSSGSENLLSATVIEMHAGSPWLIPELNGQPRIRKPPLPAWVAAALVPESLIAQLSSNDVSLRHDAYQRLAFMLRWPALLMSCFIVLATYEIGRTMASVRHGLIAAAVCASSLLLLRYGRSATTDIHLALWVALTNLCLIKAYFRGRPILWLPLAGVAAGLAFMSKGPVGLAQSVLPIAIFVIVRALFCRSAIDAPSPELSTDPSKSRATKWIAAALLGVAAMLAVALPWFVYVFRTVPDVWTMWKTEITRDGATTMRADPIHTYLVILPMLLPWTIFLIAGMVECARDWKRDPAKHLSILVLVIPIIVMSLVKDKNERYLLPLAPAGALVAAFALLPQLRPGREQSRVDRSLRQLHMIVLFVIAVGVPAAGAIATLQRGGEAWWSWQFAAVAVGLMVLIPIALNFIHVKRPASLVVLTALLMLCANALFLYGYKTSMNGRSEMRAVADDILAHHPQAEVYYVDTRESPKAIPQDLQIYLNRRVRTVYGLSPLPAPQPGRVLVVLQREHEPDPNIAGWKHFARQPWGERGWHALTAE